MRLQLLYFTSVSYTHLDEYDERKYARLAEGNVTEVELSSALADLSAMLQDVYKRQRISYVTSKARELGKYMSTTLDEEWNQTRGMVILTEYVPCALKKSSAL